ETYAEQVSEAVSTDAETAAYVEELERRADSLEELVEERGLPSGDALAAELTRFLRERERNGADGPPREQGSRTERLYAASASAVAGALSSTDSGRSAGSGGDGSSADD